MAGAGRPKAALELTEDERAVLERWARRPKSAQALALRSRIVLACSEGAANKEVAARFGVTPQMVGKWRARFVSGRLDGLGDEPRPRQPRKITDEQVEEVIVKTLERKPPNLDTHWSTRSMARAAGRSEEHTSELQSACRIVCRLLLEKNRTCEHQPFDGSEMSRHTHQEQLCTRI